MWRKLTELKGRSFSTPVHSLPIKPGISHQRASKALLVVMLVYPYEPVIQTALIASRSTIQLSALSS